MKWDQLVSSMSETELRDLSVAVSDEQHKRVLKKIPDMPLLDKFELDLLNQGRKFEALKEYRNRVGCSVSEAKAKIDSCRIPII